MPRHILMHGTSADTRKMKFTEESPSSGHLISGYGADFIQVGADRYPGSLVITAEQLKTDWPVDHIEAFTVAHAEALIADQPEVVIIGTGARQRWPAPQVLYSFGQRGIGCEVMATASACRTYNILAAEGRRVMAVLLPPGSD